MSRLHHLKLLLRGYRLAAWRLVIYILMILLFPILIFLPKRIINNCDKIISDFLLKILWFIWCVIKLCFFIVFAIILMLITPVLIIWPPLCVAIWVWAGSIKIF